MAAVERFEDLRVWQEARRLCARIDEVCEEIARKRNFGLSDQMRRAAVSIVSNIAEGFERRSPGSFSYFLLVSKGSLAELRTQLYLCADRKYLDPPVVASLNEQAAEVSRMLWGLIRYLNRPRKQRGTRNAERGTT